MMRYKEFYIWLDGFMTNRNWTVIQQKDIETIQEKMKEVKNKKNIVIGDFSTPLTPFSPFVKIGDDNNLGKPPKIVM